MRNVDMDLARMGLDVGDRVRRRSERDGRLGENTLTEEAMLPSGQRPNGQASSVCAARGGDCMSLTCKKTKEQLRKD